MSDTPFEGQSATKEELERAKREMHELRGAALDRGREEMESAKNRVADRAEAIAEAVESTADELESNGDGAVSGYGRSLASMMRQLAGGLRENDIESFARELAGFARRNPGAFLAGSVALGFGLSRFMKASGRRAEHYDLGEDLDTQPGFDTGAESEIEDEDSFGEDLAVFRTSGTAREPPQDTRPGDAP